MSAIPARQRAVLLAAGAQSVFQSVRKMDDREVRGEDRGQLSRRKIEALLPMLAGLDALAGSSAPPEVVDHVFQMLAVIGHDRATGAGLFSSTGLRPEVPYLAALQSPHIGKAMLGQSNLDGLSDTTSMLNTIENLSERLREPSPAQEKPASGPLFSEVANERIEEIKRNKGDRHETIGTYAKVRDEFTAIVGDRCVGDYYRGDLQKYVDEIAWLPPDASSRRGFQYRDVTKYIEENKGTGGKGLAAKTIQEGRLAFVKAIIGRGCADARIANPIFNARIAIPDRAAPKAVRIAPDGEAFERVWRAGIATGVLSDALLPPLGLLTGRRIALLATLFREDLHFMHDVWFFMIRSHRERDGAVEKLHFKTDASREILIVPQVMVEAGFCDWVRKASGPLFPRLMACKDPGDAAQKRLNRLIKDNTGEAELGWVFHALRHGKINHDRDNDVTQRLIMKQVGHEVSDTHSLYGLLTPKQMRAIAAMLPMAGVDWGLLKQWRHRAVRSKQDRRGAHQSVPRR